jgi:hypothetical protein
MKEILTGVGRNLNLSSSIVDVPLQQDLGVVSRETASQVARWFSMRLSLLRQALVVVEERFSEIGPAEMLEAVSTLIADEIVSLPKRVSDVRDPLSILRALHNMPEIGVAPEFISAVLGIQDERIGGDTGRHSPEHLVTEYARGGFTYQPSEIIDIWRIFEYLPFAAGSVFYDLGSGYGHALFYGAAVRPDLFFRGIELMSVRVEECQSVASRLGIGNVAFQAGDSTSGGFDEADIIFLFNPFPPDTEGEVRNRIEELADVKPLVILDYEGLVSQAMPALRTVPLMKISPYRLSLSRRFFDESRAIAGIDAAGVPLPLSR